MAYPYILVEGFSLSEISKEYGVPKTTLLHRFNAGARTIDEITRAYDSSAQFNADRGDIQRLRGIYSGMKQRCYSQACEAYNNYGGRGIRICEEWLANSNTFIKWALSHGYSTGLSIDRVDVNGNYCPENCRWATPTEQILNVRGSVYKNLRLHTKDALKFLRKYPKDAIVTIIIRKDLYPIDFEWPEEVDYCKTGK